MRLNQVFLNFGTEFSTSNAMNTIQEFKFACPLCHQHIVYEADMAGVQIECPGCLRTIVVPKSTKTTGTKLMLQGMQTRVRPTLPILTASSRTVTVPQPERASTLLLAVAVTAVLIIVSVLFYR
jgi:ribosomal protein S27E